MSTMLKCPNPSCPYAFDPSQVPTGVVLSCPRCSMQFTLGAPAAGPAAPPPPARPPVSPSHPEFEAVGRTAVEERDPDAPMPGRRTNKYQVFILAGVAAVLMAGTALAIIFKIMNRGGGFGSDSALKDKDRNIGIEGFPTGWSQDDATRLKVGSPYAYGFKRESPEAYVAFGSAEYAKGRSPRGSEMRRDLEVPMGKLFTKFEEEPAPEANWLGQIVAPRHSFKFRAPSSDGLIWQGEGYTVASKGVAYFWVGWCGEGDYDGMKDEFAKIRTRFKLLDLRNDWREVVPKEVDYKGATVPYTFTDAEDIWKESPIEEHKKVNADLDRWLRINHTPRGDRKALSDDADLRVYLLDAGGDPLQKGREYVEGLWVSHVKSANNTLPAPTFTELTGEAMGDPMTKGTAPHVRLSSRVVDPANPKIVIASTESRLVVVSAAQVGDKIVVLHCWCELAKRSVFESRFVQIASSLR